MEFTKKKLVILLGIVDYDDQTETKNLYGIRSDLNSHYKLWTDTYGYDVFPNINDAKWFKKENWSKQEIIEFLNEAQSKLLHSDYDGFIICLFAHGDNDNHLITSDGHFVDVVLEIQDNFKNTNKVESKLCIIDSCFKLNKYESQSDFITLSNCNLYQSKCVEDPTNGGLFTQQLVNILSQKPHLLSSLPSLYHAMKTSDCIQRINDSNECRVERGLKNIEIDHGVLKVPVEHGTDIEIVEYYISRDSDPVQYENHMIGIILYQYQEQNKWSINDIQCQSGYIIIVNKSKLDEYLSDDNDYFDVLYEYRFESKISDKEKNKFIGVQFDIINSTFKYKGPFVGDYYSDKELQNEIYDEFNTMSGIERIAIRHILECFKRTKCAQRSLFVKNMIKSKYQNVRTRNIYAFKPLIGHHIDLLFLDLFSTQYLTQCKGEKKWGSNNTDCKTSSKVINAHEISIYFKSHEFQQHEHDPYNNWNYGHWRHLRRLFVFGDAFFRSNVMEIWNKNKNHIRIIDLCHIARKYEYVIDGKHSIFIGEEEVDYALCFVKDIRKSWCIGSCVQIYSRTTNRWMDAEITDIFVDSKTNQEWLIAKYGKIKKIQRFCAAIRPIEIIKNDIDDDTKDDNGNDSDEAEEKDIIDRSMSIRNRNMMDHKNDEIESRDGNVSINNSIITIQSINGEHQFNINSFLMSRFSDLIDFNQEMYGMVLYLYDNETGFCLGGINDIECGYIYVKTRDNIKDIGVIRNSWYDKLFKSLFNEALSGRVFGCGFMIKDEEYIFDSSAFEFNLSKYYGDQYPDYGVHFELSNVEKRCIVRAMRNWKNKVQRTYVDKMLKSEYTTKKLSPPIDVDTVFKRQLMFSGPFAKAYEIQSLHKHHDDKLYLYKGYDRHKHIYDGNSKRKSMLFVNENAEATELKALYIHGLNNPKGPGEQLIAAIIKKFRIMNYMKLEYICDIAIQCDFTVSCTKQIKNNKKDNNEYALFLIYTGNTPQITNAMVVLLGISDYNHQQTKIKNLNGVKLDMINHEYIWTIKYNYDIFPSKSIEKSKKYLNKDGTHKFKWSQEDIYSFFNDAKATFLERRQQYGYDGMIIVISGHGSKKNTIITTDVKYLDIPTFVHKFAGLQMKQFPRLFFIDCCRGGQYIAELDDAFPVPLCICGEEMVKMNAKYCYASRRTRCNECRRSLAQASTVWHCPKDKKPSEHPKGYDLCGKCVAKNNNDNNNDKEKLVPLCECRTPLTRRTVAESYGGLNVVCDVCGVSLTLQSAVIWNCPKGSNSDVHPEGYDICATCVSDNVNTEELSIILYGNSPRKTVSEDRRGGRFTNSVLEVLGNNTGTAALFTLTEKMNMTLNRSSKQQQIVSPEGGGPRMRKLVLVGDNPQKTVDIDLKTDDDVEYDINYKNIDEIKKKRAAIVNEVWNDHKKGTNNKLWKDSTVPYTVAGHVCEEAKKVIDAAVEEFKKTPVRWVKYDSSKHKNYCEFIEDNGGFWSFVGVMGGRQEISCKNTYRNEKVARFKEFWWWKISLMHEMMHALGFYHEFSRDDWRKHCKTNRDRDEATECIKFGQFDYYSIMNYPNEWQTVTGANSEYARLMDKSHTFSQGDLAALRRIYGKDKQGHIGEWHRACSQYCTATSCSCGACGKLPGGVNCGYTGMKGHWSCCMNEVFGSKCDSTHTGFWHMQCMSSQCRTDPEKQCVCGSCGGGCRYTGKEAHWSCCKKVKKESKCSKSPY